MALPGSRSPWLQRQPVWGYIPSHKLPWRSHNSQLRPLPGSWQSKRRVVQSGGKACSLYGRALQCYACICQTPNTRDHISLAKPTQHVVVVCSCKVSCCQHHATSSLISAFNPPTHQPTNPPTHQPTHPPTHPSLRPQVNLPYSGLMFLSTTAGSLRLLAGATSATAQSCAAGSRIYATTNAASYSQDLVVDCPSCTYCRLGSGHGTTQSKHLAWLDRRRRDRSLAG
jgi:hypothetical protein